jgi:hypothetical protein
MKRVLIRSGFAAFVVLLTAASCHAEDWTTQDGNVYLQVTVVKVEADAVTILYRDGGALVPLVNLPVNLQERLHYDPEKARVAADVRAKEEARSTAALQAEILLRKKEENESLAAEKAAENAKLQRVRSARIRAYGYEPAVLEPENHTGGILNKPK